jgi:hypothetical protein
MIVISNLALIVDTVGRITDVAKTMICRQSITIFRTAIIT